VLINLLRNAFAAAGRGGQVKVSVERRNGTARISVWDSAGSIPPEDLSRIFEPFYSTRQGGTGLGLSTAFSIVRAHGGMIDVRSSPQGGTTFTVGLPQGS
jgi:two-component system sensor histidine kinase PilS (NtrC family)